MIAIGRWLATMALISFAVQARAVDVAGSVDFAHLERFPESEIVRYQQDPRVQPHDVILSSVDRIQGKLRVKQSSRVNGSRTNITYLMPPGVTTREAFEYFSTQLKSGERFRCSGPGCGRSSTWANDVFGEPLLNGTDASQNYLAAEIQINQATPTTHWIALYLVERGNRQVMAHVRVITPTDSVRGDAAWRTIHLANIDSPTHRARLDPKLLGAANEALLGIPAGEEVLVACHLYEGSSPITLVSDSFACAEEVADALAVRHSDLIFQPVGVGPVSAKPGARPRVELILKTNPPTRLQSQRGTP